MRDRLYIFLLLTTIGCLAGWLVAFDALNQPDVIAYDGRLELAKDLTIRQGAQVLAAGATKQAAVGRANAATSSPSGLPISGYRLIDPIRVTNSQNFNSSASSALVMNAETGRILYEQDGAVVRSIASITKLFTALVFLDFNPGWDKDYTIKKSDRRLGGRIYTYPGERLKIKDLFNLSLVASGNSETVALINATGLGEELFVKKMNEKAQELGLAHTNFVDAVGLNEGNVSTAEDVAKFARLALAKPEIADAVTSQKYQCKTQTGRLIKAQTTDDLLKTASSSALSLEGGKTGYNDQAGYCFVAKFSNDSQHPLITVVLGEATKQSRFSETLRVVGWAYDNYAWPAFYNRNF